MKCFFSGLSSSYCLECCPVENHWMLPSVVCVTAKEKWSVHSSVSWANIWKWLQTLVFRAEDSGEDTPFLHWVLVPLESSWNIMMAILVVRWLSPERFLSSKGKLGLCPSVSPVTDSYSCLPVFGSRILSHTYIYTCTHTCTLIRTHTHTHTCTGERGIGREEERKKEEGDGWREGGRYRGREEEKEGERENTRSR